MTTFASPSDLAGSVGSHLGYSDWLEITQERINAFADATDDHQWIHVDPERAKAGPFGTTIAHGYLTLSLAVRFVDEIFIGRGRAHGRQLRHQQGPIRLAGPGRLQIAGRRDAGLGRGGSGRLSRPRST